MTEGCSKLGTHLDSTWLPWDAQDNNPELHSTTVLSGSTVTFEFQLIKSLCFSVPFALSHTDLQRVCASFGARSRVERCLWYK